MGRYDFLSDDLIDIPVDDIEQEDDVSRVTKRLVRHLERGDRIVPILSNSIRTDWILDYDYNEVLGRAGNDVEVQIPDLANIEQELAQYWAFRFKDNYPFSIPASPGSLADLLDQHPGILDDVRSGNGLEASSTPQPDAPPDIQADDGAGNGLVRQLTRVVRDLVRTEQHLRQVAQYNHLARVAQYRQLIPEDDRDDPLSPSSIRSLANEHYLKFLKWFLLQIARRDPAIPDSVSEELVLLLREGFSFSDLAQELGYPRFNEKYPDILRQLAKLPLPIYITTGYYDFLERLLQVEDKHPITQICFHRGEPSNVLPEHRTIHHYEPSINKPVVYHLYGFERYPASLVISESDYMDFLLTMAQDTDTQKPVIPLYIRDALADSDLLLLGYRLPDWDFRVLFRSLLKQDDSSTNRKFSVALQLDPGDQENIQDTARARRYLRRYFKSVNFSVVLSSTVDFVQKLCEEWDR